MFTNTSSAFKKNHRSGILISFLLFFIFPASVFAQKFTVTGQINGTDGAPISNVSILEQNTTNGTTSDSAGNFSLNVNNANATLVVSSLGYTSQTIPLNGRSNISVTLQGSSAKELEQVVVVGYGTQRKRDITGAISTVKGAEIAKQPVLTATQAIQGKVAGVQIISSGAPNSAPVVRIRGTGSILGGVNPLYVVDGVLTDDIRNINSADIVSLEVLKDASAAAIYGVRAANGVIIITTKKGRTGKMQISYDANAGIRQASHLVKMANAKEYANYINTASVNTGNGSVLVDTTTNISTDWFGTILRTAFEQNHNVSVSGGSDKITYFLSANYLTDEGIVLDNNFKRFTIRSNNEYRLSDKLKVTTLISFSRGNTQDVNLGAAYNDAYHAAPIIPSKINGKYGNTSAYQNVGNPVLDIESNDNKYIENRLQGTGAIDYKPVSWLTLHSSVGTELGFNNRTIYVKQFLNDSSTYLVSGGNQYNNLSNLSVQDERNTRWVWDNTATFQKSYNKNDITFLAGVTAEKIFNNVEVGSRSDVPADPNLRYLSQGDPSTQLNNSDADERTRNSYISRLSYAYDNKYLLTATFRADGSSQFSKRFSYSPSIGLGWVITDEKFMETQKIFNRLKLRGSYGRLGNDNIPLSASIQTLNTGLPYFFNGTYVSGIAFSGLVDKNIRWEQTDESDLGLEFGILNNRLTGEIDVYDKKVNNALIQVPLLIAGVVNLTTTNVATIENKGAELSLTWNGNSGKKVGYTISGNVSYNKNNVVALNGGQSISSGAAGQSGNTTLTDNGEPIGSFYVLKAEGVFHNQQEIAAYVTKSGTPITINGQPPALGDLKYEDVNGDGKIDANDRVFAGSYQPKFTFGLNANVTYQSFDLSLGAYGTLGSKIYNGKKAARFNQKDNVEASVANNFWTYKNYTSNVPRAYLNALPQSTYFLESGDFARINNLTIGYTFSQKMLGKYGINNFRIYLTAQNLYTFTKYSGFTPELASSDPLSQGIELNAYPTTRTFAFGVNLTF
ncbi:MAG TPA: TonB-dependent receptor [Hanamia sp.]|nr:TonB-dependent receptor [Hanamia sp.]